MIRLLNKWFEINWGWIIIPMNRRAAWAEYLRKKYDSNTRYVFLIDIDGTICEDIKNEDSHLYKNANPFLRARKVINGWYDEGHSITLFTAREEKDRDVTIEWLDHWNFKYHGLVMNKPRIKDGEEYVWIDNRKVRAITYLGTWSELKEVDAKIKVFK